MNETEFLNTPLIIEKELRSFFKTDKKILIFDIGSCDGLHSIKYSNIFPESQIYAFEPLEKNFQLIEKNIVKYNCKKIVPFNYALSDEIGQSEFFVSSGKPDNIEENDDWEYGNKSSSLLPPAKHVEIYPWIKFNETIKVNTWTLDDFCENNSIKFIDFIHLDVQGAELMVLHGAESMLPNIKMILLEVGNVEFYKNQTLKNDIEKYLAGKGFTLIKDEVGSVEGDQLWVNYKFFLKKRITHNLWKCYSMIKTRTKV